MSGWWHESAFVDEGAVLGEGTRVWHFSHVAAGARIGRSCVLGQNVYVAPTVVLGDGVRVQNNVSLYDGVLADDQVFIGPSAVFTNVAHPRAEVSRKHAYRPTRLGRGATIGANATIVCGHTVGAYALVGAGAVVTRDVAPHALVVGVPAAQVGWACRCGVPLPRGDAPRAGDRLLEAGAVEPPHDADILCCLECPLRWRVVRAT
jgi:UDP-2-acetamido-3-amino-2,3-dideoxy-glucuronate N-acetyltransferase